MVFTQKAIQNIVDLDFQGIFSQNCGSFPSCYLLNGTKLFFGSCMSKLFGFCLPRKASLKKQKQVINCHPCQHNLKHDFEREDTALGHAFKIEKPYIHAKMSVFSLQKKMNKKTVNSSSICVIAKFFSKWPKGLFYQKTLSPNPNQPANSIHKGTPTTWSNKLPRCERWAPEVWIWQHISDHVS